MKETRNFGGARGTFKNSSLSNRVMEWYYFIGFLMGLIGFFIAEWWLIRHYFFSLQGMRGVQKRDEIEAETILLFQDLKKSWDAQQDKQLLPFIQKEGISIALKYPRASTNVIKSAKGLMRELAKYGINPIDL